MPTRVDASSSGALPSRRWAPGARVADWELGDMLGRGGMGAVFRARHLSTGHECAIKALPLQSAERGKERFRREGAAMAAVDQHPNVLRVHSAGEALGHMYLVMDLAPGGDLQQRIERDGPLDARTAAGLVAQLARGLAHVHAQGILHRDLKPANVLFDGEGRPQLVDFGLARSEDWETLTKTGAMLGTPAYMPSEQVRGKRGEVDARSDVYGLGAVLHYCLTGSAPFQGDSMPELIAAILVGDVVAPSVQRDGLSSAADAIVLKALATDAAERYANAAAFAEDLERVASGADSEAKLPGVWTRLRRRYGRRLTLVGLPLALALIGGGIALGVSASGGPTDAQRVAVESSRVALERARQAGREARLGSGNQRALATALAELETSRDALRAEGGEAPPQLVQVALGELEHALACGAFDRAFAAGEAATAEEALAKLAESPGRSVRAAALEAFRDVQLDAIVSRAEALGDGVARAEILLLAARAALRSGEVERAVELAQAVATPELADWRAQVLCDALLARARAAAGRLDVLAASLVGEASAHDAERARAGVPDVARAALAAEGKAALCVRVLDGLADLGELPAEAAQPYLQLAGEAEARADWKILADHVRRARQLDPQGELPGELGLVLASQASAQINRGERRSGYALLLEGVRAGLPFDIRRKTVLLLRDDGLLDAAVAEKPEDWAARYWRAVGDVTVLREQRDAPAKAVERSLGDLARVLAEPSLAPRWCAEAQILRLRCLGMQNREAGFEEATRLLRGEAAAPWSAALWAGRECLKLRRVEEGLEWARQGVAAIEAREVSSRGFPGWAQPDRGRCYSLLLQAHLLLKRVSDEALRALAVLEADDPPPRQLRAWRCELTWVQEGHEAALRAVERELEAKPDRYLERLHKRLLEGE